MSTINSGVMMRLLPRTTFSGFTNLTSGTVSFPLAQHIDITPFQEATFIVRVHTGTTVPHGSYTLNAQWDGYDFEDPAAPFFSKQRAEWRDNRSTGHKRGKRSIAAVHSKHSCAGQRRSISRAPDDGHRRSGRRGPARFERRPFPQGRRPRSAWRSAQQLPRIPDSIGGVNAARVALP